MSLPFPGRFFSYAPYYSHWQGDNAWPTVRQFANTYHCWPHNEFGVDGKTITKAKAAMAQAVADKRRIHLCLDVQNYPELVTGLLKAAAPYWERVAQVEMCDEPKWSLAESKAQVKKLRALFKSLGLQIRPVGVVFTQARWPAHREVGPAFDWLGIECYVDPPGGSAAQNEAALRDYLIPAIKAVPSGVGIILIGQSYLRNYERDEVTPKWHDPSTIGPLLKATYRLGIANPKVFGMHCFSWLRATGAAEYPAVAQAVRAIGNATMGA